MTMWYAEDDRSLIEAEANALRAAGEDEAAEQVLQLLDALDGTPGSVTRAPGRNRPGPWVPDDRLLSFEPATALTDIWASLHEPTRNLLEQARMARERLGDDPQFARAVGIYIALAFEEELRDRSQFAYVDYIQRVEGRRLRADQVGLGLLWRFLHTRGVVMARYCLAIEGRNRVAHALSAFDALDFNRFLQYTGLLPAIPGVFHELIHVVLP